MAENATDNYGWSCTEPPCSCAYLVGEIQKLLKQLGVKRVLDVGAGNGALCAELAGAGYDVVGGEYDQKGVEIAQAAYPQIPFYCFGVQDNPSELLAREQPFDAVVSTEVVEHLYSPHLLPIYAKAVLKKQGYLIVSTPYHRYLKNLLLALFGHWDQHHSPLWHGGHIKFWSRATLSRLLCENGFRIVGFHGVGRLPYLWKSMVLIAQAA